MAIPGVIALFAQFFNEVINIVLISSLNDPVMLAGVGLGNTFMNTLGMSIYFGGNVPAGTFMAQSYGMNNMREVGHAMNRARLFSILTLSFAGSTMLYSDKILLILKIEDDVIQHSHNYLIALIPFVIFHC